MIALADVKQASKTLMFAERKNDPTASPGPSTRRWDYYTLDGAAPGVAPLGRVENGLGFSWPDTITPPSGGNANPNYDPSTSTPGIPVTIPLLPFRTDQPAGKNALNANLMHPGVIIMTFCDGHVDSVSEDTGCKTYYAVPDLQSMN